MSRNVKFSFRSERLITCTRWDDIGTILKQVRVVVRMLYNSGMEEKPDRAGSLPKEVKRWSFYNFANHSYQLTYVAFLLPVFFSTVLLARGYSLADWGAANGISTVIGVAIAVIVGRYADTHDKLRAFKWSIILSFLGMLALSFSAPYFPAFLYWIFVATNAVFIWSIALSDSILPHVSNETTAYHYGGFAWGFGYMGGIASLILALILQYFTGTYSLWVFLSVPIFYLLLSWYSVAGLKDIPFRAVPLTQNTTPISTVQRGTLFFGYWLISECITVISLFASIYFSTELHLSVTEVGILFLVIDLIAFPSTWFGGVLAQRYSSLKLLGYTIILLGVSLAIFISPHAGWPLLSMAVLLIGLAYGNSQSYLRSQYSTLVKPSESGFQFGMYSVISEAAVLIGPVLYGYASDQLHSQKIPMIFLFGCMLAGYAIVWRIVSAMHPQKRTI
jgi:UMF1 family MFS transporter